MKKTIRILLIFCICLWTRRSYGELKNADIVFPLYVYKDFESPGNHGAPSGWMGDYRDILLNLNHKENAYSGKSCIKITYSAKGSRKVYWAGIMWQYPANNDGVVDAGLDLNSAGKLVFWARGEKGGEIIDSFGLGGAIASYPDSDSVSLSPIVLSREWKKYEIDLRQYDLRYISSFFSWVASKSKNLKGMTFYLDEIKIEKE